MKVLFVCRQNRGRSQMAEALFNKYSKNGHADSTGTLVETPGDSLEQRAKVSVPQAHVISVIKEEGVDISKNLQTKLAKEMLDSYDKIVVMAEHETIPKWLKVSPKFEYWEVEDPRWEEQDKVRQARDDIKQRVLELINKNEPR